MSCGKQMLGILLTQEVHEGREERGSPGTGVAVDLVSVVGMGASMLGPRLVRRLVAHLGLRDCAGDAALVSQWMSMTHSMSNLWGSIVNGNVRVSLGRLVGVEQLAAELPSFRSLFTLFQRDRQSPAHWSHSVPTPNLGRVTLPASRASASGTPSRLQFRLCRFAITQACKVH